MGWHIKKDNIYTLHKYVLSRGFICVDPEVGSTKDRELIFFAIVC